MNDITVTQRQLNYLEDVVYNRNLYYTPSVLAKHINKVAWKFDGNYEGVNIWNNNIYNAGEATWSYDQTNEAIKGYRASDYINNAEYQFGHLIDSDVYTKFRIRAKSVLGGINIKFRYSDDSVDAFWSIDDWNPAAFDEIEVTIPAGKLVKGIIFNSSSDISGAEWYIEWMKIYEIDSLARDINIFHTGDYLSAAGGFTGMQGNVGVGMKNPASMSGFGKILHIQGTDDASLRLQGSGGSWEIGINTANALQFYRSASDLAMVIDNTSNVGINNPDPSYGFDANCTGRFTGNFYANSSTFYAAGAVELDYNTVKKFETTSAGVNIIGAAYANTDDKLFDEGDEAWQTSTATNPTWNMATSRNFEWTMASSGTLTISNGANGNSGVLILRANGAYTATLPASSTPASLVVTADNNVLAVYTKLNNGNYIWSSHTFLDPV